jgi:hypothetical protein
VIGHGDSPRRWIATDDVAALMAAVAVEPDPPAMLTIGGPEAMTKKEAIALAEQLTQRKMKVQRMPRTGRPPCDPGPGQTLRRTRHRLRSRPPPGHGGSDLGRRATARTRNHAPPGQRFHTRASPRLGMSKAGAGR